MKAASGAASIAVAVIVAAAPFLPRHRQELSIPFVSPLLDALNSGIDSASERVAWVERRRSRHAGLSVMVVGAPA